MSSTTCDSGSAAPKWRRAQANPITIFPNLRTDRPRPLGSPILVAMAKRTSESLSTNAIPVVPAPERVRCRAAIRTDGA